ncbi:protocadherin alpha-8-like [Mya arenaria]|uniref:protocadherin alpha-8-like n=1 Tax=Mya arenaria TaxID=6604 RepID=UPI0022E03B47|nr:protocadherin alpha-8-like [Mya arenaria]
MKFDVLIGFVLFLLHAETSRGTFAGWTSPAPGLQMANGKIELTGDISENSISAGGLLFLAKATGEGDVHYTIKSCTDDFASINSSSGAVSLAHDKGLDYESNIVYEIVVSAKDQEGSEATATVVLSISDANDNAPVFTESEYTMEPDKILPYGTPLVTLTAIDADGSAPNNVVGYNLSADDTDLFAIDNVTGTLKVVASGGISFTRKRKVVSRSAEATVFYIKLTIDLVAYAFDKGVPQNIVEQVIKLTLRNIANLLSASFFGLLLVFVLVLDVVSN